jgi:hypothetical protein
MTNNSAQPSRQRDYKRETALRKKRTRRLLVDIEINKAERFLEALSAQNVTLVSWITKHIDDELNA